MKEKVTEFKQRGFFITNDAELFANVVMELHNQGIHFKFSDPGDMKYCITEIK